MGYTIVDWNEFVPIGGISCFSKENKNPKIKQDYTHTIKEFMVLDTETSHNHDDKSPSCWIYQWAFTYNGTVVMGRRPTELMDALKKIAGANHLGYERTKRGLERRVMVIYIHNLSYDWEYIKMWLRKTFHEEYLLYGEQMLAVKAHKLISYSIAGFEFRCSYRLSGKSLDSWSKEMATEHRKLVGNVDYEAIHYQDSPLTQADDDYMINDAIVLDECLRAQMALHNDTIETIPLTITGYVRRAARRHFYEDLKANRRWFQNTRLSLEVYKMCREEFSGGITHGNRYHVAETVNGVIRHRDFASHYPSQQVCYTAPIGKFILYYDWEQSERELPVSELAKMSKDYCFLASVAFTNLHIKEGVTLPYAQAFKFKLKREPHTKFVEDNGRILHMDGKTIVTLNEIDLKWICKQYDGECKVLKVYRAKKGRFPKFLIDTVNEFFVSKTEWKMKEKAGKKRGLRDEDTEMLEIKKYLQLAKGMLNGIFGMLATDPVRWDIKETGDGIWEREDTLPENIGKLDFLIKEKLGVYYNTRSSFMSYQLGVWTTANARNELMEFVELIGYENFLYADTDSIFYISTPEIEERVEAKNAEFRKIDDQNGYYIEVDGKRVYYNQFELENEEIVQFRFLHAKCYAYVTSDGELHTTIAGVTKIGREGVTRVEELGTIDKLEDGMVFKYCGGTTSVYLAPQFAETYYVNGHNTECASGVVIKSAAKELKDVIARDEYALEYSYDF